MAMTTGADCYFDVPPPVLLNTWKHHAGAIRRQITAVVRGGERALAELPRALAVIGTDLMDLYTGALSPAKIASEVIARLRGEGRIDPAPYRAWLEAGGGFQVLDFSNDGSRWVLRLGGEQGRYVHVHPARGSPHTRRVRANVLKTAILVLAHAQAYARDLADVAFINEVRKQSLGLPPIVSLSGDEGLGLVLDLLRPTTDNRID
jgi:hypothetical protein